MTEEISNVCIVVAAGMGERLGADIPKALVPLGSESILFRTLTQISSANAFDKIVITFPPGYEDEFRFEVDSVISREKYLLVQGGATRQGSVRLALESLGEISPDSLVAVHDAARCMVTPVLFKKSLEGASLHDAVTVALPMVETVKRVDSDTKKVIETLKRDELWRIQTPQVFRFSLLLQAHERAGEEGWIATDDASLVEHLAPVHIVLGEEGNMKITTPADLELASTFMK